VLTIPQNLSAANQKTPVSPDFCVAAALELAVEALRDDPALDQLRAAAAAATGPRLDQLAGLLANFLRLRAAVGMVAADARHALPIEEARRLQKVELTRRGEIRHAETRAAPIDGGEIPHHATHETLAHGGEIRHHETRTGSDGIAEFSQCSARTNGEIRQCSAQDPRQGQEAAV